MSGPKFPQGLTGVTLAILFFACSSTQLFISGKETLARQGNVYYVAPAGKDSKAKAGHGVVAVQLEMKNGGAQHRVQPTALCARPTVRPSYSVGCLGRAFPATDARRLTLAVRAQVLLSADSMPVASATGCEAFWFRGSQEGPGAPRRTAPVSLQSDRPSCLRRSPGTPSPRRSRRPPSRCAAWHRAPAGAKSVSRAGCYPAAAYSFAGPFSRLSISISTLTLSHSAYNSLRSAIAAWSSARACAAAFRALALTITPAALTRDAAKSDVCDTALLAPMSRPGSPPGGGNALWALLLQKYEMRPPVRPMRAGMAASMI